MTCFTIKGCERRALEPFVAHLNAVESTAYTHHRCLHSVNQKQPEELFVDAVSGSDLVIERKSIAWPDDYEHGHAKDHTVVDTIFAELRDIQFDKAYTLRLPYLIQGSEREARQFALAVAESIRKHVGAISGSRAVGSNQPGLSWRFYEAVTWELPEDAPSQGVTVLWNGEIDDSFINPNQLPAETAARLDCIFDACVAKFQDWSHARRILVLDQLGALRYNGSDWWKIVFSRHKPPREIDEIWLGIFDWLDDWNQDWIFEKLWPCDRAQDGNQLDEMVPAEHP
jgi:hypothetical protein